MCVLPLLPLGCYRTKLPEGTSAIKLTYSQNLSGCPSLTDSEVKRKLDIFI